MGVYRDLSRLVFDRDRPVTNRAGLVPFVVGDFQCPVAIGVLSIKDTEVALRTKTTGKWCRASGNGCPRFVVQCGTTEVHSVSAHIGKQLDRGSVWANQIHVEVLDSLVINRQCHVHIGNLVKIRNRDLLRWRFPDRGCLRRFG